MFSGAVNENQSRMWFLLVRNEKRSRESDRSVPELYIFLSIRAGFNRSVDALEQEGYLVFTFLTVTSDRIAVEFAVKNNSRRTRRCFKAQMRRLIIDRRQSHSIPEEVRAAGGRVKPIGIFLEIHRKHQLG